MNKIHNNDIIKASKIFMVLVGYSVSVQEREREREGWKKKRERERGKEGRKKKRTTKIWPGGLPSPAVVTSPHGTERQDFSGAVNSDIYVNTQNLPHGSPCDPPPHPRVAPLIASAARPRRSPSGSMETRSLCEAPATC